jgi:FHA domain-containing protein
MVGCGAHFAVQPVTPQDGETGQRCSGILIPNSRSPASANSRGTLSPRIRKPCVARKTAKELRMRHAIGIASGVSIAREIFSPQRRGSCLFTVVSRGQTIAHSETIAPSRGSSMQEREIKITLVDAHEHERQFEFEEPQLCIVGRARDCDISTSESDENLVVSRHHCLLEIDPPAIRVHDLGSTNGTYVNGVKIPRGRRDAGRSGIRLYDGDEVGVGPVRLRVHVPEEARDPDLPDFALEFNDMNPNVAISQDRTTIGYKNRSAPGETKRFDNEDQGARAE